MSSKFPREITPSLKLYLNIVFPGQNNSFQDLTNLTVGVHFPQKSLGDQLHKTRKKIITVYTSPTSNTRKKGFHHREGRVVLIVTCGGRPAVRAISLREFSLLWRRWLGPDLRVEIRYMHRKLSKQKEVSWGWSYTSMVEHISKTPEALRCVVPLIIGKRRQLCVFSFSVFMCECVCVHVCVVGNTHGCECCAHSYGDQKIDNLIHRDAVLPVWHKVSHWPEAHQLG